MERLETLEQQVLALTPEELIRFRAWFLELDWTAWDRQFEDDAKTGRLDSQADQALRDHASGKTTRL